MEREKENEGERVRVCNREIERETERQTGIRTHRCITEILGAYLHI